MDREFPKRRLHRLQFAFKLVLIGGTADVSKFVTLRCLLTSKLLLYGTTNKRDLSVQIWLPSVRCIVCTTILLHAMHACISGRDCLKYFHCNTVRG